MKNDKESILRHDIIFFYSIAYDMIHSLCSIIEKDAVIRNVSIAVRSSFLPDSAISLFALLTDTLGNFFTNRLSCFYKSVIILAVSEKEDVI